VYDLSRADVTVAHENEDGRPDVKCKGDDNIYLPIHTYLVSDPETLDRVIIGACMVSAGSRRHLHSFNAVF
jgi:hypothetical protein